MTEGIRALLRDLRYALRTLASAKGLTITVVLTLALGIGANAAIYALVRGVLLRPLVNRDEDRLIYIRQSANGMGMGNAYFSVPEIQDLKTSIKTLTELGDFSTIGFTMVGVGEPREVAAGVVGGSYFQVMGLHPVLGRVLDERDDGPKAAGAMVLTYRFWATQLKSDPSVLGKQVRLESYGPPRIATIVGVLEPSVPYPADTEIIANVVTSPHHLSATMVTGRIHRMTELFGRLAPGKDLDAARAELRTVHAAMVKDHPDAYPPKSDFQISAMKLRDQITSRARNVLLVLMAASLLVFVIACSNVANLILARTVRRENELGVRAALGATNMDLRWTLLAESVLLCVAGAGLGLLSAEPMVKILARYASRFSVRALDLTVDSSMMWVGAGLAVIAAVLLAFVPHLPSAGGAQGFGLSTGSVRVTGGANRRLRVFAVTQIAASFVLLAGAGMLIKTLISLETQQTGLDLRQVLAINVPVMSFGKSAEQVTGFYQEAMRRIHQLPQVAEVAVGTSVPWRDAGSFGPGLEFAVDNQKRREDGNPRAQPRTISPGFFAALGVPLISGRTFTDADSRTSEKVVIVSQTLARRMFSNQDAVGHNVEWVDPVLKFIGLKPEPLRIVGVAADIDDEHVVPQPTVTVYSPMGQGIGGGRLFVHAWGNPYALVTPLMKIVRNLSADQVVERASTLEDVRAEVLTPDRMNALVFGVFAAVALTIAVVGVAGVLTFSVSGRTREFGIRMAVGAQPWRVLAGVVAEGAAMATLGIFVGAASGYGLARVAGGYLTDIEMPGAPLAAGAALVLLAAAVIASALPAMRAARVEVMQALRAE